VYDTSLQSIVYCFFFFFQAEDGIRDRNVTGVQTCALPILASTAASSRSVSSLSGAASPDSPPGASGESSSVGSSAAGSIPSRARSEERRVGKGGRCRWSADDTTEK